MSIAQASGVYNAMQKRKTRRAILKSLSEDTQKLWEEFSSLSYWEKPPNKLGLNTITICMIVYFFFKGELISFKEAKKLFLDSINNSNKRYEELSQKKEIVSALNLLKQKGVAFDF